MLSQREKSSRHKNQSFSESNMDRRGRDNRRDNRRHNDNRHQQHSHPPQQQQHPAYNPHMMPAMPMFPQAQPYAAMYQPQQPQQQQHQQTPQQMYFDLSALQGTQAPHLPIALQMPGMPMPQTGQLPIQPQIYPQQAAPQPPPLHHHHHHQQPYQHDRRDNRRDDYSSNSSKRDRADRTSSSGQSQNVKEIPGRVLFVRNVSYELPESELKKYFQQYGDMKEFFSLKEKRGMCFVSYFDIRDAIRAREEMNGKVFNGRAIDIHFSLPKDTELGQRTCDRDKNQGTLFMICKNSESRLDNDDLKRLFSQFGELKCVRDYKNFPDKRFIEFYDARHCALAYDRLNGATYCGGTLDLEFAWDTPQKLRAELLNVSQAERKQRRDRDDDKDNDSKRRRLPQQQQQQAQPQFQPAFQMPPQQQSITPQAQAQQLLGLLSSMQQPMANQPVQLNPQAMQQMTQILSLLANPAGAQQVPTSLTSAVVPTPQQDRSSISAPPTAQLSEEKQLEPTESSLPVVESVVEDAPLPVIVDKAPSDPRKNDMSNDQVQKLASLLMQQTQNSPSVREPEPPSDESLQDEESADERDKKQEETDDDAGSDYETGEASE